MHKFKVFEVFSKAQNDRKRADSHVHSQNELLRDVMIENGKHSNFNEFHFSLAEITFTPLN